MLSCQVAILNQPEHISSERSAQKIPLFQFDQKLGSKSDLAITDTLNNKARLFLKDKDLIKPDEEMFEGRVTTKWGIYRTAKYDKTDLLVMSNMLRYDGSPPILKTPGRLVAFDQSKFN